jgi:molecular chaperone DnaK (HSP70)
MCNLREKNMRIITITTVTLMTIQGVWAQTEISLREETQAFSLGSKNALVVTIPYANKDILEKELKSELKDWGGKYNSSKDEFSMMQGAPKFMESKAFDAYARILPGQDGALKVAFGIDLGGAFLSSREHSQQFTAMSNKIKEFAKRVSKASLDEVLKADQKNLESMEKAQKDLEKEKSSLEKDIEDYKKKIAEAEDKIKKNAENQGKQKELISKQMEVVKSSEGKVKEFK